jgi:hypothetical protein
MLKKEYLDLNMTCPFTGKFINTTLLDPDMYPFWINKGFGYMFEEETKKPKKDDISKS